ncbi:hypothetical protein ACUXAV_005699 [Cupriavidus metallidurans]|uniref:hypothetical protein n=1 Tax=Cupriavidus TaxID=106589 RepID=UPI000492F259|nr:hypothetical protein [Cupriavidus metallidurans]KWW32768.1 hypothetical protein AU374_05743 [Cupriavidus metallidurans]MDE4920050.1 hypothetical protein [Cupriavidus metallidurans]UBM08041.1 hypothetical protein LAI70_10115 [Cupriavidus metallidurans]
MTHDLARKILIGTTGFVLAAVVSWSVMPDPRTNPALAAINSGPSWGTMTRHGASSDAAAASHAHHSAAKHPPASAAVAQTQTHAAPREQLEKLRKPMSAEPGHDPFTASSWLPPPPPPPPPEPVVEPPPTPPPLPFSFLGALDGNTPKPQIFLGNGDRLLIVSRGDVIDGQYRIDAIATESITFTYLPLNMKQVLPTQSEGK